MKKKAFALFLALALVVGGVVGGTVAWLTAKTDSVVNTFTVGDINIELTETTPENQQAKMVPGNTIKKNPTVTVKKDSEACWLFVKVEESENLSQFIEYSVITGENGWTALDGVAGVYYREVPATTADVSFAVLTGDTVKVKDAVTKTMMEGLKAEGATQPTLTFTAYAVQKDNVADAAAAWAKVTP